MIALHIVIFNCHAGTTVELDISLSHLLAKDLE